MPQLPLNFQHRLQVQESASHRGAGWSLLCLCSQGAMRAKAKISTYRHHQQAYLPWIHLEEQPGKREQLAPCPKKSRELQTPEALALDALPRESKGRPCYARNGIMDMGVLERAPIDPAAGPLNMIDQSTSWR